MKMKDQLESVQQMKAPKKKQKQKSKKTELKKKKQGKQVEKKLAKEKASSVKTAATSTSPAKATTSSRKATLEQPTISSFTLSEPVETEQTDHSRQRVSKHAQPLTVGEQTTAINLIIKRLMMEEMSQGMALRELRVRVLGLKQDTYSTLVGVSRKTLSEIENDKGNYTSEIINKVFKPFDLKVGLVPTSSQVLSAILIH